MTQSTVDEFHELYYSSMAYHTSWRGVRMLKCAQDVLSYQEILYDTQPEVVECGVYWGGSTLFFAELLQSRGGGIVVACDRYLGSCHESVCRCANVRLIEGDSVSPATVTSISALARGKRTMVVLDSDHGRDHVLQECRAYGPLVSSGCYLIVEDTIVNGNPIRADHGPGPAEAIASFLQETEDFEVDRARERLLSFNRGGYLKRKGPK